MCVVKGEGPMLLGRDWLSVLQLDWSSIKSMHMAKVHAVRRGETSDTESSLQNMLMKYTLFDGSLGCVKGVTATLKLKESADPKFFKARQAPYALKDKIEQELHRLEGLGVLEKVEYSDWAAPVVPVLKADGSIRLCGDYKVTVNPVLEVPQYPLPRPEDLYNQLNGGQRFTKLDLSQAYQQVVLDEPSRNLVTINTHLGLYRYTRLPYGVASAPAVFQQLMDKMLVGLTGVACYLDDLLITGKNDTEHLANLEACLARLQDFGVKLKKTKCAFMQTSLEYLGFRLDAEGIHPTASKVQDIRAAATPTNLQELQSFLGLVNYYRKFIPNLSSVAAPLNRLLSKDMKFNWNDACAQAFAKLKESLTSDMVLVHYCPDREIYLTVDASPVGLGAVISHQIDGEDRPIAFVSRSLISAERNYSQLEREGLAIIFGINKFHKYLFGKKFTLVTDNKPLTHILAPKNGIPVLAASRLQRWAIQLSAYQYDVKFRPTKANGNVDALSRLPAKTVDSTVESGQVLWTVEANELNTAQVNSLPIRCQDIAAATRSNPVLSRVKYFTLYGWPTESELDAPLLPYFHRRMELTCEEGCLLWGVRVIIPQRFQNQVLQLLHDVHVGMVRMKARARMHVWWPKLDLDIENTVKACPVCQAVAATPPLTVNPWVWPTRPYQRIHVDFAGPVCGEMFLIVVDARSKWPEAIRMSTTSTSATIHKLQGLFASYGLPEQLCSDNGPQFSSREFATFMKSQGIKHILSSPYHPASNGEAERFVRTFKAGLKALRSEPGTLQEKVNKLLMCYRTTPHTTTHETPAECFLGRRLRTTLESLKPNLGNTISKAAPRSLKDRKVQVGDPVLVRDYRKNSSDTWIRGVILKQLSPVTYRVQCDQYVWKRHIDQLLDLSGVPSYDIPSVASQHAPDKNEFSLPAGPPVPVPASHPAPMVPPSVPHAPMPNDNEIVEPMVDPSANAADNNNTSANRPSPIKQRVQPRRQRNRPERLIETM
jgi:transposase InsO family protein